MHAVNMLDDMFANVKSGRAGLLGLVEAVAQEGRGVVVVLREPTPTIFPIARPG